MAAPDPIRYTAARLRRLLRVGLLARSAGRLAAAAAVACALDYLLDRQLHLPVAARAVVLALGLTALGALLIRRVLRPALQPMPDHALLLEMERRGAGPDGLLTGALHVGESGDASRFGVQVVEQARCVCRGLAPGRMIRWRTPCAWGLVGIVALMAAGGLSAVRPEWFGIWVQRNLRLSETAWPHRTHLSVTTAPRFVAAGQKAAIRVIARGVVPRAVEVRAREIPSGESIVVPMTREGGAAFGAELGPLRRHTAFRIAGGDDVSAEQAIAVVPRPEVAAARLVVSPPAYISPAPVDLAWQSGDFQVPEGSRVQVVLDATTGLSAAECRTAAGGSPAPEWLNAERSRFAVELDVTADMVLSVDLIGKRGVRSAAPFRARFRAIPDEPPEVHVSARGIGELVAPGARLPIAVTARDDYGIGEVRLVLNAEGIGTPVEREYALTDAKGRDSIQAEAVIALSELPAAPGQRISVQALAADRAGPSGQRFGRSAPLSFRVVSIPELLNSLLLTQLDLRRDLEHQARLQTSLLQELQSEAHSAAALAGRQRDLAPVLSRTAEGYADVLDQMLNNGVMDAASHSLRTAAIPGALRALAGADGPVARAATALERAGGADAAGALMRDSLASMARIRASMMLLEGYASIVASVREISGEQQKLLDQTEKRQESTLKGVFGP